MSTTANSKMFLRVSPNSFNPVMGGFIILQDHKPRGPYKEVVFRQQVYPVVTMSIVGTVPGANVSVAFSRGSSAIKTQAYTGGHSLDQLVTKLNNDCAAMGTFTVVGAGVEISDPIHKDLVAVATYS